MADTVQDLIRAEAKKQGIPASLALAVAEQESGFNPTLTNPKKVGTAQENATGVFQLLPSTAKGLGVDPSDPRQNITGGVKYLRSLMDQHQGDVEKVLANYGGVVTDTEYVPSVLKRLERFKSLEGAAATVAASQAARSGALGPTGAPVPGASGRATGAGPAGTTTPPSTTTPGGQFQGPMTTMAGGAPEPSRGFAGNLVHAFSPMTSVGRRNLVSLGAESIATAALPEAKLAKTLWRVGAPAVAAGVAGGAESAVEGALGTEDGGAAQNPLSEGAWQGAYSVGGQVFAWPLRAGGQWLAGSRVARFAKGAVEGAATQAGEFASKTMAQGKLAIAAAKAQASESLKAARVLAANTVEAIQAEGAEAMSALGLKATATNAARATGQATVERVKAAALDMMSKAELENSTALAGIKDTYNSLTQAMPSAVDAAQRAREVFEGPTKIALNMAGERVGAAAATGPRVAFAPIQATVKRLEAQAPTTVVEHALAAADAAGGSTAAADVGMMATLASAGKAGTGGGGVAVARDGRPLDELKFSEWVAEQAALLESGTNEARDTLPVILQKIRDADVEQLDYSTMHALKRVLDAGVNWDRAARQINEQLTKATRIAVRKSMRGYAPYDTANAAYESLVNIYRKGVGKRLSSAFINNPDAASKMLTPSKPIAARQLRSLLVDQAAAGGDAQGGQQAWDAARSVYVHQNVLNGGIKELEGKLTQLQHSSDFYHTVFSDPSGEAVINNLWSIAHGYSALMEHAAERTAAARGAGQAATGAAVAMRNTDVAVAGEGYDAAKAAISTAQASKLRRAKVSARNVQTDLADKGAAGVTAATEGAAAANTSAATAKQTADDALAKFKQTSLGRSPDTLSSVVGDISHIARVGAATRGTVQAVIRLFTGPNGADMLQYLSHSPKWTRRFVQVTQSPVNDRLGSAFIRDFSTAFFAPPEVETPTLDPSTADAPAPVTPTVGTDSQGAP